MRYIIMLLLLTSVISVKAQENKIKEKSNWHHLSFDKDSVYGAEVVKAYDFLQGKEKKKQIVVAIIDGSCDTNHEDLKNQLWVNEGEIPNNGIDDDGNGYIDDINGWNFLGNNNGSSIIETSDEGDRYFVKVYEKYKNVDTLKLSKKSYAEYQFFNNELHKISPLCKEFKAIKILNQIMVAGNGFELEMKAKYPHKMDYSMNDFLSIMDKNETNKDRINSHFYFLMTFSRNKTAGWNTVLAATKKMISGLEDKFEQKYSDFKIEREMCGDDMNSLKSTKYGNNKLNVGVANHSTHVAGIVGAERGNNLGIDGVADVKLMIIRILGTKGDEYDKDVALAIKYAVDNGANIINMSFGKYISSNKKWVDKSLKHAQSNNVLLIHGAGNSSMDVDRITIYPTKVISGKKELNNFINVGAISSNGNPGAFSNYGLNSVDVFAPGVNIYSSIDSDEYSEYSGTSMAAPVVSGVAALVWSYYPELTANQLRDLIISNTTDISNKLVPKPKSSTVSAKTEEVYFKTLCKTGGLLNAYKVVQAADKMVNK